MRSVLFLLLLCPGLALGEDQKNKNKPQEESSFPTVPAHELFAQVKSMPQATTDDFAPVTAPRRLHGPVEGPFEFNGHDDPLRSFRDRLRRGYKGIGIDKAPGRGVMITFTKEW